jgi:5-methylcytosine-specific restriction protein B
MARERLPSLVKRQEQFLEATRTYFGTSKLPQKLFGASNSAKITEGGIFLGGVSLDGVRDEAGDLVLACVMRFPPEDEVYFAVRVRNDMARLVKRLADMKALGTNSGDDEEETSSSSKASSADSAAIKYKATNNNVSVYLARDGRLWLRNKGYWDTLNFDRTPLEPSVEPDQIVVALYPPTASARRSLLARGFIGWLGELVGREKIHELQVWRDDASLGPAMLRMPSTIPVAEIEAAVRDLGGHYPKGEVRRLHTALNFLGHKHFVILAGISGTGKTQLALKYARAVHGVSSNTTTNPLIFECPVRPEWTDPSGLTGYFDVLTNRYVVPTFLEAVLVATAHRESPVFVVLDEMNLARVEYYLADVLACMETQGALQLHSNGVPLEGTTGGSIPAEVPLPSNLFIVGTINVDETTNPVSDKVLDRASVIDLSAVDVAGFMAGLESRYPELAQARSVAEPLLAEIHALMQEYGLAFGYRLIEEFVRYHAFDLVHIKSPSSEVTDQLLMQKILVKLRGAERQRLLLTKLEKLCVDLPQSRSYVRRLLGDLDDFGSFQAMR